MAASAPPDGALAPLNQQLATVRESNVRQWPCLPRRPIPRIESLPEHLPDGGPAGGLSQRRRHFLPSVVVYTNLVVSTSPVGTGLLVVQ